MTFTQYLQAKKLSPSTVERYTAGIQRFLRWLYEEDIKAESFTYSELLDFMRHCHQKGVSKRSVQDTLCMVRHYCTYLIHEGKREDNPAAGVYIRGLVRKLPANLLEMEELEELYKAYSLQLNVDSGKKIMLGLLVYQGLTVGELMRLQAHHIKLKEGKVWIKGTKRTNERLLALQAIQIPLLQSYLQHDQQKEGPLFIEAIRQPVSEANINNRIKYMFGQLRKLNPKIINAKQIRNSIITHWLRTNNLRQVQYLSGHKYVSSTQRYQPCNLDDLQNELQQHHPMN